MPKSNTGKTAEVQRQRLKLPRKGEKYGPSTIYLQVLGSGARGAPNTLYLFTDQKRYLFNCGECSQRLAHEHKVKLSRLDHIFITSKTWRNVGGLPGLSLTLQDVGVPNITLHGPEGLDELYNATKRFVIMKDLNVTMAKCSPTEDFEDNVMSVKYVLLGPHNNLLSSDLKPAAKKPKLDTPRTETMDQEFEEFIHDDTDYYRAKSDHKNADNNKNKNLKHKPRSPVEKDVMKKRTEKLMHNLNKLGTTSTVAYICTLKKRLGTLDLEKCVEFGVKPGPLLGQLKSGQDVVLPDGRLVLSKDVKTPDDPGPVFIVLEVPDITYLKEDEFAAHFDDGTNPQENIPAVVVHYTPPHVFDHPVYQSFMALFGPTTRHLILNAKNSCLGSEAVHRTQHKLHLLDPDIFPLLKDLSVPAVWNAHPPLPKTSSPIRLKGLEELKNKIALAQFQTIINMDAPAHGDGEPSPDAGRLELLAARTLTVFHLRPKRQLDRSAEPKLHIQDYIQETMDVDGFVPSLEQFRRLVDTMRYAKSDAKEYPKVVFLGTGSCIPSKTRNTSAIVLQIDEQRSMLLDCGEGTFGQLVRFYGPKRVNAFLRTLKAIYISHLHADHHIGLIGVLQARREALDEVSDSETEPAQPLYLMAPGQIVTWLSKYDQQFESIRGEFTLIPNQNLTEAKQSTTGDMTSAILASLGIDRLVTCYVSHCPNAFGVAVQVGDGHKVTYSGDTIPCDELVKIGQNSTLLIHEATMEDELENEARIKMHSTTSQAIEVGRAMCARYTVLTHFSQRYARLPRLNAHILNDNKRVGIAFDNMQITMSDLDLLPHMYAPLQLMFAEHCVELELKAAHRARVKEKQPSSPTIPTSGSIRHYSTDQRQDTDGKSDQRQDASTQRTDHIQDTDNKSDHRQDTNNKEDDIIAQVTDHRQDNESKVDDRQDMPKESTDHRQTLDGHIQDMVIDNKDDIVSGASSKTHSPSREQTLSQPKLKYRESNASKLRQVRNGLLHGGILTPNRSKSCSPEKRLPRSSCPSTPGSGSAPHSPERTSSLSSRAASAPPKENKLCMEKTPDSPKPTTGSISSAIRSKRSNSGASPKDEVSFDDYKKGRCSPKSNNSQSALSSTVAESNPVVNTINRSRSPLKSWKAENKQPLPASPANRRPVSSSKLPVRTPMLKGRASPASSPKCEQNCGLPVNRSLRQPSSSPPLRSGSMAARQTPTDRAPKDTRSNTSQNRPSFNNNVYARHRSFNSGCNSATARDSLKSREILKSATGASKSSTPSRESIKPLYNQKRNIPKDTKPVNNRVSNFSNQSNKSFKPQLEDIKSSYLLLQKNVMNRNMKCSQNTNMKSGPELHACSRPSFTKETPVPPVPRPEPISEEKRRMLLLEAKHKFKTKQFWNDEKYNKIEGLNWISWK
ncbi:unnamed protein product [Colias eurytheme]|nr:unnamed protein product [Colias eurytheme]